MSDFDNPAMRRLILPNDPVGRGGMTLYVPRGYETEQDRMDDEAAGGYHLCRVLIDAAEERICGTVFELGKVREYQRHLRRCAAEHIDEIRKGSPHTRMPFLSPNAWDPEVEEHMRAVGRRMAAEGRLEVKKSERAGF